MILKRSVREDITRNIYESSNILASTYNKKDKDLVIVFKHGGQYLYTGVEERDYVRFETADSQGKVLNSHIKKYPFSKIGDANVEKIKEEIESDRLETKKEKLSEVIEGMKIILGGFSGGSDVDEDLIKLQELITKYQAI